MQKPLISGRINVESLYTSYKYFTGYRTLYIIYFMDVLGHSAGPHTRWGLALAACVSIATVNK